MLGWILIYSFAVPLHATVSLCFCAHQDEMLLNSASFRARL